MPYIPKIKIGSTTYDVKDTAAWNEIDGLKRTTGRPYDIIAGSYVSNQWSSSYYSAFIPVRHGAHLKIKAASSDGIIGAVTVSTVPPTVGDAIAFSSSSGWTTWKSISANATFTGVFPSDATHLYIYAGNNTSYIKWPVSIEIDGVEYRDTIVNGLAALGGEVSDLKDQTGLIVVSEASLSGYPTGIQPFQMSLFKPTTNIFNNFCNYISGGYYGIGSRNQLSIKSTSNWKGWLIKVKPNTTYTLGPCDFRLVFFNPDLIMDKAIETTDLSDTTYSTITSGTNSYWMSLAEAIGRDMSGWMMVEGDTYPSGYISGHPEWVDTPKSVTNKTIAFFGDSITAGSGWTGNSDSQGYHQYIHDLYGFTCLNYGYGGSGYVTNYEGTGGVRGIGQPGKGVANTSGAFTPNTVRTRLAEVTPSNLDGVVIFAGTNDWSHQVPLADFSTELDAVYDYYQTNFGSVPLLVMTPIHRINDTSSTIPLSDYVDRIIQKCRAHGIPYIDTFTMSGLQPNNSGNSAIFFPRDDNANHTIDGIHPNHLAHQRLARCIGETLNQMMLWNETAIR